MSFNENNPATSTLLISGDMRANFLATRRHMYSANLLMDPLFECWPDTDAGPLAAWTHTVGGGSLAREVGVADRVVGDMSARVTFGVSAGILSQDILAAADYDPYFDSRVVTAGCFLKTSTGSIGRIRIDDGGGTPTNSAFHTGGGAFEFLDVEHLIDPGATKLTLELRVEGGGNVIFCGPSFLFSDLKPDRFVMPPMARNTLLLNRGGDAFLGSLPVEFVPQRPFIVEHVQLRVTTAPTGADLIVDVNQFDGATFSSMFTVGGRPRILAGAGFNGGDTPDGTYNRKCFGSHFGSAVPGAGDVLQAEIDNVGSSIPGENLIVHVRYKTWLRPQEIFAGFSMVG